MRLMYHAWKHHSESFSKYLCTAYECTATPNSSGCLWSAHNDRTVSRRQLDLWAPHFCIHKTSSTAHARCLAMHSRSQLISSEIKCWIPAKSEGPVKRATIESRLFTLLRAQLHRAILWAKKKKKRQQMMFSPSFTTLVLIFKWLHYHCEWTNNPAISAPQLLQPFRDLNFVSVHH